MASINDIHWFPGHRQKALRARRQKLQLCDGVIEIGDARAPFSSFPDYLDQRTQDKVKVYVFSKADLADPDIFPKQREARKSKGIMPFSYDLRNPKAGKDLLSYLSKVETKNDKKYKKLGFPLPSKRFRVLGIPNVGKSTFINSLAGKKKAAVENRPGKTRDESLIHISEKVYIFDSPGILEPNYQDKEVIAKLALLGSVKQDILPLMPLSDFLLDFLSSHYPDSLQKRYGVSFRDSDEETYQAIALARKLLLPKGEPDSRKARSLVLSEFKVGTLGRRSLDGEKENG